MRFFLIMAGIAGLCFFAFRGCHGLVQKMSPALPAVLKETDGTTASPTSDASKNPISVPLPAGALHPSNGKPSQGEAMPEHCEIVRFLHRAFPPAEFWNQFGQVGLRIVSDEPSRTVYIYGTPDAAIKTAGALRGSDELPQSCTLKAWAVYVDRRMAKGWDLITALGAVLQVPDSVTVGGGNLTFDFSVGDLQAALDVIADGSAVEVMQAPHCLLLNREPATVEALQEVPLPATVVSQGVSQSSIQYRKVGLQLEVVPEFFGDDRVRLKVSQSNGLIGANVSVSGSDVPVIETQRVSSTVELTVGQAVVLGGVRTTRRRTLKGLLRDKEELTEGAMYVVLATGRDAPRAVEIDGNHVELSPALEGHGMPFGVPIESSEDWIDGQLLPPRNWEREERAFLKGRGRK